jgi:hypothetical protein
VTDVDEQIVVNQPRETKEARDALDWQDDSAKEKAGDDR